MLLVLQPTTGQAPITHPHSLPHLLQKGENVKRIRRESSAVVSVAEPVLGCDERVVHITGERCGEKAVPDIACMKGN